jgi:hypothetical protein
VVVAAYDIAQKADRLHSYLASVQLGFTLDVFIGQAEPWSLIGT